MFEVRRLLEGITAELAAQRATAMPSRRAIQPGPAR